MAFARGGFIPRLDRYLQTQGEPGGMTGCGSDGGTTATASGCVPEVNSPLPYIVAGLVAMVLLIVLSFCILVYSFLKKQYSSEPAEEAANSARNSRESALGQSFSWALLQLKAHALAVAADPTESDKLMVIMAGDEKPTFLASPTRALSCDPAPGSPSADHSCKT